MQTAPVNATPKPPRLEDQIRAACRLRHYSLSTEKVYVMWYRQFVRWAGLKHPATLGGDRVEAWLSHLAIDREVSASDGKPFLCHSPLDGTLCAGWVRARAELVTNPLPPQAVALLAQWEYSPADEPEA